MEKEKEIIKNLKEKRFFREKAEEINSLKIIDRFYSLLFLKINEEHIYPIFDGNENIEIKKVLSLLLDKKNVIKTKKGTLYYSGKKIYKNKIQNIEILNGNSSNTILTGEDLFIKFYRELSEYSLRESSILKNLEKCFKNTPEYFGTIFYEFNKKIYPLFLIQKKLNVKDDLWNYLSGKNISNSKEMLNRIGKITADLHNCFIKLKREKIKKNDIDKIIGEVVSLKERLKNNLTSIELEPFLEKTKRINFDNCNFPASEIHGDYHLGQIVLSDEKLYIVDFEGEPIGRKSEIYPILYDVAGMVRSIDYLINLKNENFDIFKNLTFNFLKNYFKKMEVRPSREDITLLNLLILRKNLYEVLYEINNRPDFTKIPLNGLFKFPKIFSTLSNYNWA